MDTKTKQRRVTRNFDERLSPGEALLVWRRRMGWNQIEAAEHFGVSLFKYKLAEYDKAEDFPYRSNLKITLKPHEKCLLYRKRSGKTQPEAAHDFGMGRFWLRLQEKGEIACDRLLAHWERTG